PADQPQSPMPFQFAEKTSRSPRPTSGATSNPVRSCEYTAPNRCGASIRFQMRGADGVPHPKMRAGTRRTFDAIIDPPSRRVFYLGPVGPVGGLAGVVAGVVVPGAGAGVGVNGAFSGEPGTL